MNKTLGFFRSTFGAALLAGAGIMSSTKLHAEDLPPAPAPPIPVIDEPASAMQPDHGKPETLLEKTEKLQKTLKYFFEEAIRIPNIPAFDKVKKTLKELNELYPNSSKVELLNGILTDSIKSQCISNAQLEEKLTLLIQELKNRNNIHSLINVIEQYGKAIHENKNNRFYKLCLELEQEIPSEKLKFTEPEFTQLLSARVIKILEPLTKIECYCDESKLEEARVLIQTLKDFRKITPNHIPQSYSQRYEFKTFCFGDKNQDEHATQLHNYLPIVCDTLSKDLINLAQATQVPIYGNDQEIIRFANLWKSINDDYEVILSSNCDYQSIKQDFKTRVNNTITRELVSLFNIEDVSERSYKLHSLLHFIEVMRKNCKDRLFDDCIIKFAATGFDDNPTLNQIYYSYLESECLYNPDFSNHNIYKKAQNDLKSVIDHSSDSDTKNHLRRFLAYSFLINHNQQGKGCGIRGFLNDFTNHPIEQHRFKLESPCLAPLQYLADIALSPELTIGIGSKLQHNNLRQMFTITPGQSIKDEIICLNEKYLNALLFFESIIAEASKFPNTDNISINELRILNNTYHYYGLEKANSLLNQAKNQIAKIHKDFIEDPMYSEFAPKIDPYTLGVIFNRALDYDPKMTSPIDEDTYNDDTIKIVSLEQGKEDEKALTRYNPFGSIRPLFLNSVFKPHYSLPNQRYETTSISSPAYNFLKGYADASLNEQRTRSLQRLRRLVSYIEESGAEETVTQNFNRDLVHYIKSNHEKLIDQTIPTSTQQSQP